MIIFRVMEFFRKHIIKTSILLLFAAALVLVLRPASQHHYNGESVSNWLLSLRSDTESPEVHEKIASLRSQQGDLPGLLRQASSIVSEHADDFTLPVNGPEASDEDIYNTLLLKWTMQQQSENHASALHQERNTRNNQAPEPEQSTLRTNVVQAVQVVVSTYEKAGEIRDFVRRLLQPLSSGIAINAP